MNKLLLAFTIFASISLVSEAKAQSTPETLATVNSTKISLDDYRDFVFTRDGGSSLVLMVDALLIEQAAASMNLTVDENELAARVSMSWQDVLAGQDESDFLEQFQPFGFNKDLTLKAIAMIETSNLLLEQYVVATRIITDAKLEQAFFAKHGHQGIKVEVAHIMVMPHYIRAEALRNNQKITFEQAQNLASQKAEECLRRLTDGESFDDLVIEYSNDTASNSNQGVLPTYRPGMYGENYTQMVDSLSINGVAESIVKSGAGLHIIRLNSKVITKLEDVRDQLSRELLVAAPTISETKQAIIDLRAAATIAYYPAQTAE
ncbi:MAG: peptidylprolyl isomerase [Planctomycetes bacterium]|nr:peptidylprolyl isomerase [Planctomycetota bacterium]